MITSQAVTKQADTKQTRRQKMDFFDYVIILLMLGLFFWSAYGHIFQPNTDAARYQCYTVAFWQGLPAAQNLPAGQCTFLAKPSAQLMPISPAVLFQTMQRLGLPSALINFVRGQASPQPFHLLPYEYPMLTLVPFSLSLLVPQTWFQVAFACLMLAIVASLYYVLLRWRSRTAAVTLACYLVLGCYGTVAGRFDMIPASLTLISVIFADHKRWKWAFVLLALAVLYKFYPVVLLLPFLIAQQQDTQLSWRAWKRWLPPILFVFVCAVVMSISLALNVEGTISPFSYFGTRPIQVESLPASILWIADHVLVKPIRYVYTYGSINILGSGASLISSMFSVLELLGVLFTLWLLWRRKLDLATASLLMLLVVMVTGKIFSPQYLIWILPLIAYVGNGRRSWFIVWSAICLLTTCIYPFIYSMAKGSVNAPKIALFFPTTTLRNLLFALFVISLFYIHARRPTAAIAASNSEQRADHWNRHR
ncbi:glycosyltransferase family 87 protein [Dictyobacter arantiisoli]|uniref:DUF2029 domain-containing protein n=1 Tax=Dictyobacter arantiisoli TaxID=2014874 RepID=A0A5A5TDR8_9CHLR|nr:glycosyltransferase family 87 protein [Dictyobacter arantiisoli]GCF09024.1 hypothetical protein KDI_25880 [Dictyobacter arantiisoli]